MVGINWGLLDDQNMDQAGAGKLGHESGRQAMKKMMSAGSSFRRNYPIGKCIGGRPKAQSRSVSFLRPTQSQVS